MSACLEINSTHAQISKNAKTDLFLTNSVTYILNG